jgi:hypothetical protein
MIILFFILCDMFESLLNEYKYIIEKKIGLKNVSVLVPPACLTTVHFQIYSIAIEDKVRLQLKEH